MAAVLIYCVYKKELWSENTCFLFRTRHCLQGILIQQFIKARMD